MRTPEEIKVEVRSLMRTLRKAGLTGDYIRKNIGFILTDDESDQYRRYQEGRFTLHGDDGPYWKQPNHLQFMGIKLIPLTED